MGWHSLLEGHPEYVQAIGMISIENANLELALGVLLAAILNQPSYVGQAIYLTPKAASPKLEILRNTAKAVFRTLNRPPVDDERIQRLSIEVEQQRTKDRERIVALAKDAQTVIDKRNRIIHDAWGLLGETEQVARQLLPIPVGIEQIGKPVEMDELTDLIRSTRQLIDNVHSLTDEFRNREAQRVFEKQDMLSKKSEQPPG